MREPVAEGDRSPSTKRVARFVRFLLVGGLNTLFGFAAYSSLILLGARTWVALILGNIAGILFNFVTVGGLVFATLDPRRLVRFTLCYLGVLALNLQLIRWTIIADQDPILAQGILVLPMAALSYFLLARFVFKRSQPS